MWFYTCKRNARHLNIFFQNLVITWCVTIQWDLSFWEMCHNLIKLWHIKLEPQCSDVKHFSIMKYDRNNHFDKYEQHKDTHITTIISVRASGY